MRLGWQQAACGMCPLFVVDAAYEHTLEMARSFLIHHPGIFADTFHTSSRRVQCS